VYVIVNIIALALVSSGSNFGDY